MAISSINIFIKYYVYKKKKKNYKMGIKVKKKKNNNNTMIIIKSNLERFSRFFLSQFR